MAKNNETSDNHTLALEYNLLGLPTAQHKAGLAGLLLLIGAMRELKRSSVPEIELDRDHPELQLRVKLTSATYQTLMNELYGGCLVEVWAKQQRKDENKQVIAPLREETKVEVDKKTGKPKNVIFYVYEDVAPEGPFFKAQAFGNLADKKGFLKLWRDAIWGTVRGIPTTRNPYKERQQGKDATGSGIRELWDQLIKEDKNEQLITMPVASSIWLGSQDHNAEYIAFQGSPKETLLLHFWNCIMQVFVPQVVERDNKTGGVLVTTGDGYILAIPEVSNLIEFSEQFRDAMTNVSDNSTNFRPSDSLICLPQEGALQLMSRLTARAQARATRRIRYSVSAIEVFHLHKPGNVVMTLAAKRLVINDEELTDFERIHRKTHPLLRAHLIRALLRGDPWYHNFNRLAADTDAEWLVAHAGSDFNTSWFCSGVREQFQNDSRTLTQGATA